MSLLALPSTRHPLWRVAGWGLVAGTLAYTALTLVRGPRALQPQVATDLFGGPRGSLGTITEQLGSGRFVLAYEAIHGREQDLFLSGVRGRLEEPEALWLLASPAGHRSQGHWILDGPLDLGSQPPGGAPTGKGRVDLEGPALRWDRGSWQGLAPLRWEELAGAGQGIWHLPAGWQRDVAGRLTVPKGPVRWTASGPGSVRSLVADSLWAEQGFARAHLEGVQAEVEGGQVSAGAAEVTPESLQWSAPITFHRADGWQGTATAGFAPRPAPGEPVSRMEFREFHAQRGIPGGMEALEALGARWTPAGLRLEGSVQWRQPLDGQVLLLRAPRVLLREAAGPDLPADLPVGEAWAEGQAVLTWGRRSLGSPRIAVRRASRAWTLEAPVMGRAEDGTFTAGRGEGTPAKWQFEGPVQAQLTDGSTLRGARLTWAAEVWTLTGSPVTWTRLRERLSGPRLIRQGERVAFPEGLSGTLAAPEGDISLSSEQGQGDNRVLTLTGRVVCTGPGWRLEADTVKAFLGPGRVVEKVEATGQVRLLGRLGEGRGAYLELDPRTNRATWKGKVRGLAEVGAGGSGL